MISFDFVRFSYLIIPYIFSGVNLPLSYFAVISSFINKMLQSCFSLPISLTLTLALATWLLLWLVAVNQLQL